MIKITSTHNQQLKLVAVRHAALPVSDKRLAEIYKKAIALSNARITRQALAMLLGIKASTVRDVVDIPFLRGVRDRPTKYQISDVVEYLQKLNPDQGNVWSEQYLSTRDTAELLSIRLNRKVSSKALVKRRERGSGPNWNHVTVKIIRYRLEDVEAWLNNVSTADIVCNQLHRITGEN